MNNIIQLPKSTSEDRKEERLRLLELHANHNISNRCFIHRMQCMGYMLPKRSAIIIKPKVWQ